MDLLRRWIRLMAAAVLLCCVLLPGAWAAEGGDRFRHHFIYPRPPLQLPARKDGSGGTTGGYARLASALKEERAAHPGGADCGRRGFLCGLPDPGPCIPPRRRSFAPWAPWAMTL